MNPQRLGIAALGLCLATWAQLALVPLVHQRPTDVPSVIFALLPVAAVGISVAMHTSRPSLALASALGAYPTLLGLSAFVSGRHEVPRFDAPSRVIAALSLLAYALAVVLWWNARTPSLIATVTPLDDRPTPVAPPPPMRRVAFAAMATMATFLGVLAPAMLGARDPSSLEDRAGGDELLRGRGAMVSAAGMLLAVALLLGGGASMMRAPAQKPRTLSRALVYFLWAIAAFVMRYWLDHAG